jgi:F-type H+-transporting ATPase subunit delta
MIPSEVARRYAQAIFEIGLEEGAVDQVVLEVSAFARAFESSVELRNVINDPMIALDAKRSIVKDLGAALNASTSTRNAMSLLVDRRRFRAVPAIASALRELADKRRGVVRAQVLTARPLSDEYTSRLRERLEQVTGKRIVIEQKVDDSLMAGVIARVGDTVFDGSLRSRLSELKSKLAN